MVHTTVKQILNVFRAKQLIPKNIGCEVMPGRFFTEIFKSISIQKYINSKTVQFDVS